MTVKILSEGARNPAGIFKHIPQSHPTKKRVALANPLFNLKPSLKQL